MEITNVFLAGWKGTWEVCKSTVVRTSLEFPQNRVLGMCGRLALIFFSIHGWLLLSFLYRDIVLLKEEM